MKKRKNFYVSPDIQKTFIIFISVEIAIVTIFFLIVIYFNQITYNNLLLQYINPSPEIVRQISLLKKNLIFSFITLLVGNILLISFSSLFFSHKIGGPLYRLKNILQEINKGALIPDNFKIRKNDLPKSLANEVNNFFFFLKEKEEKRKKKLDELRKLISELPIEEEMQKKMEEILEDIKK